MNYIAEINAFYDRLELNPLPSPTIVLWQALMHIANKTGWQQEFTVASSVLSLKTGLNAQAIKRARNRLEQDEFLIWRARGGNLSAQYQMISLVVQNERKFVPQNEPQNEPQCEPHCEPQSEPKSVPINKDKHKQNKTYTCVSGEGQEPERNPQEDFAIIYGIYPKKVGKTKAYEYYLGWIRGRVIDGKKVKLTNKQMYLAVKKYVVQQEENDVELRFYKGFDSFLSKAVLDYLEVEE